MEDNFLYKYLVTILPISILGFTLFFSKIVLILQETKINLIGMLLLSFFYTVWISIAYGKVLDYFQEEEDFILFTLFPGLILSLILLFLMFFHSIFFLILSFVLDSIFWNVYLVTYLTILAKYSEKDFGETFGFFNAIFIISIAIGIIVFNFLLKSCSEILANVFSLLFVISLFINALTFILIKQIL